MFGSFNAPMLALVMPPLLAIKALDPPYADGNPGLGRQKFHALLIGVGVVGGLLGTCAAVSEIVGTS